MRGLSAAAEEDLSPIRVPARGWVFLGLRGEDARQRAIGQIGAGVPRKLEDARTHPVIYPSFIVRS